jgi:hypothetical protein
MVKWVDHMEVFPIRIPGAGFLQQPGRLGKIVLHGCLIAFFLEHFADKSRDTGFLFCSADSGSGGDFIIECDGYIFHNKNIVETRFVSSAGSRIQKQSA